MNVLALTPAVRDALHSLEETIIDYQLEQQGFTSNLVRLCAAETLVNLTERQKIAFRNDKAFFSPKIDATKECLSILNAFSKSERIPSEAARSLVHAYTQIEKAERIAASTANTVNQLELDIARSISALFGPDEVPDPNAIAKLLCSEQSQAIEQEISLAKSKLLAPIVSAYIAAHPELLQKDGNRKQPAPKG